MAKSREEFVQKYKYDVGDIIVRLSRETGEDFAYTDVCLRALLINYETEEVRIQEVWYDKDWDDEDEFEDQWFDARLFRKLEVFETSERVILNKPADVDSYPGWPYDDLVEDLDVYTIEEIYEENGTVYFEEAKGWCFSLAWLDKITNAPRTTDAELGSLEDFLGG